MLSLYLTILSICPYSPSSPSHSRSRIRSRSHRRKSYTRVRPSGLRHPRQSSAEDLDVARLELAARATLEDGSRRKNGIAVLGASSNPSMHRGSSRIAVGDRQPNAEAIQPRRVLQRVVAVRRPRKRNMHHQQPQQRLSSPPHPKSPQVSSYVACGAASRSSSQPLGKEQRVSFKPVQWRLDKWVSINHMTSTTRLRMIVWDVIAALRVHTTLDARRSLLGSRLAITTIPLDKAIGSTTAE
ncbi:hypothetical protein BDP55DRAFT_413116 [Colletotrichum godetiae]|uniref:Uncharacterized protein n=1 Tax=Colletotrichum godetiae TaxID=1209918 RepID=A0AAJ0AVJ8_9PEZI|nr:uncharacterized protein BDP55DRAFT_413116 [Colletotrichum godetiae]KAK1689645.1 hypothetical protein BDP55DRAFT_413116 [Colletotrichum godetiae]